MALRSQHRRRKRRRDTRRPKTQTLTCLTSSKSTKKTHIILLEAMRNISICRTPCQTPRQGFKDLRVVQIPGSQGITIQCLLSMTLRMVFNTMASPKTHLTSSSQCTMNWLRSMKQLTCRIMAREKIYNNSTALGLIFRETARTSVHMPICTSQAIINCIFRIMAPISSCLLNSKS